MKEDNEKNVYNQVDETFRYALLAVSHSSLHRTSLVSTVSAAAHIQTQRTLWMTAWSRSGFVVESILWKLSYCCSVLCAKIGSTVAILALTQRRMTGFILQLFDNFAIFILLARMQR